MQYVARNLAGNKVSPLEILCINIISEAMKLVQIRET